MKNSKKSVAQHAKVFKQLNGVYEKTSNDLDVTIAVNYSHRETNLFQILTRKYGSKIG